MNEIASIFVGLALASAAWFVITWLWPLPTHVGRRANN